MESHYRKVLHDTEEWVIDGLRTQERDRSSGIFGAFYDRNRMVQAKYSLYRISYEISCYLNEDSRFFGDEKIFESIVNGLKYVRSVQHENGLFDYITCNFFSAPDTAFIIGIILPHLDYLREKKSLNDKETAIRDMLEEIFHDGVYGLLEGGFHTPNHRWAIASLLCKGYKMYGDEKLKTAAFEYLKEGIDCNEDGEYAEKSAGNYNGVNNDAMILLSEALGDDTYDKNAVRNLELMLIYT